jgi:hypothetical protein
LRLVYSARFFLCGARRGRCGCAAAAGRRAFFFWCSVRAPCARLRRGGRSFFFVARAALPRAWLRCLRRAFVFLVGAARAGLGLLWRLRRACFVAGARVCWGCAFAFPFGVSTAGARRACAFWIVPVGGVVFLLPALWRAAPGGRACRRGAGHFSIFCFRLRAPCGQQLFFLCAGAKKNQDFSCCAEQA